MCVKENLLKHVQAPGIGTFPDQGLYIGLHLGLKKKYLFSPQKSLLNVCVLYQETPVLILLTGKIFTSLPFSSFIFHIFVSIYLIRNFSNIPFSYQ